MFSEAHAHVQTKPPAPPPATTLTQRCSQPMPMHNIQLEQHYQRQQQQLLGGVQLQRQHSCHLFRQRLRFRAF